MDKQVSPQHVAVIPDGNRRWAKQNNVSLAEAYQRSATLLQDLLDFMVSRGVDVITIWPISNRTFWRSRDELQVIIDCIEDYLHLAMDHYRNKGYRFQVIGRRDRLKKVAPTLVATMEDLERATAASGGATVVFALDYCAAEEIERAFARMRACPANGEGFQADALVANLDTAGLPDPDILIRTGGDRRLSGFLPLQLAYTEIYFRDELLPDLNRDAVDEIFREFARRRYSQ